MHRPYTSTCLASAALAVLAWVAPPAAAQAVEVHAWGSLGTAPSVAPGQTISATQSLLKSNYSDNPSLLNSAWAHAGGSPWYAFQVLATGDIIIDLSPVDAGADFNPGITVWATGSSVFDGGSDDIEVGANNGWTAPHSFNAVGQVGDDGTLWASASHGNLLQTLAYAVTGPAHTDPNGNGWGEVIKSGVNDISLDDSFEQGVTGTAVGNRIQLAFNNLSAGWYLAFIGGTNHALTSASYTLSVTAAVPEPSSWVLTGLGLVALGWGARRRRA